MSTSAAVCTPYTKQKSNLNEIYASELICKFPLCGGNKASFPLL